MSTNNSINRQGAIPLFFAYQNGDVTNVTGDGTVYTTICNTEVVDSTGSYNTGTGQFTAPYTGYYQLNFGVTVYTDSTTTTLLSLIDVNGQVYNGKTNYGCTGTIDHSTFLSTVVYAAATNVISFQVKVSDTTKKTTCRGQAAGSGYVTYVSGWYLS